MLEAQLVEEEKIIECRFGKLQHPPYSPDLAPFQK